MKRSDKKRIHKMEVEDALGIKRGKKSKFKLSPKAYIIIKICLIALIPLVYFLYSPLLIVAVLLYFCLIFITSKVEKKLNDGMRKDLKTNLPKLDSILCLILIIITICGIVVSSVSTTQKKSPFEGMNSSQFEEMFQDIKINTDKIKEEQTINTIKNLGSLLTGTRILFEEEKTFGGKFGGGRPEGFEPPEDFELPENFTPPSGDFSPPDMNKSLQDMPFSVLFSSILKAGNIGLLIVVCLCGLLSIKKIKRAIC